MHQPPGTAIDQGQRGGDHRVVGRAEPDPLRQREADDHARLRIVGQALPRGAVDQRIEVGDPAQCLARYGDGEPVVGRCEVAGGGAGGIERPALAKHGIEHLQRGAARADAFGGLAIGSDG